ncbi:MAG: hypothetical protein IJS05_08405 [Paludibacteraceae bacterium]|nr:hypothetical protein [Paludibacteraceae bacterium]
MRNVLLLSVLIFGAGIVVATNPADIEQLEHYLQLQEEFDAQKRERIAMQTDTKQLFDEYASYIYDSASYYSLKFIDESRLSGNPDKYAMSQICRSFLYLSGGLFKESADLLESIDLSRISDSVKLEYYCIHARLYYDLADYNKAEMSHYYLTEGNRMTAQALTLLTPADTARYWYLCALQDMKQSNYVRAIERFLRQLESKQVTDHEKAITFSSIAYIYTLMDNIEKAQHYYILAAINDICSSTKEAVALQNVARILFKEGDVERAARYIQIANEYAQHYNARHRKQEISEILPIIENEHLRIVNEKNRRIELLSIFLYVMLALLVVVIIFLLNRMRAVSRATETIKTINQSLREANKIKEEYLGTFLCWQSDFINQFERYQRQLSKRLHEKQYNELITVALPPSLNASRKRQDFYKQFDEMFLRVFPNFVDDFNSLLRDDEHLVLKRGELLNTELRIFALMRLGITDNEKIAQVLDYSVNTIYTYKTRVKNRSDLTQEEFKERFMNIGSMNS